MTTPGPWTIQPGDDPEHREIVAADEMGRPGRAWIALAYHEDARLIAAAPQLLAACREALGALLPGATTEQTKAAWLICQRAVAEAEGQP